MTPAQYYINHPFVAKAALTCQCKQRAAIGSFGYCEERTAGSTFETYA